MKTLVVSVVIMLGMLSTAGAQQACRPDGGLDMAGLIGSTVGALVGSTIGDGRGQTLATGVGALVGGVIAESLSSRHSVAPANDLVKQLHEHRSQVIEAAVSGAIPMPRKVAPVRLRQGPTPDQVRGLAQCQELEAGVHACLDGAGNWHVVR